MSSRRFKKHTWLRTCLNVLVYINLSLCYCIYVPLWIVQVGYCLHPFCVYIQRQRDTCVYVGSSDGGFWLHKRSLTRSTRSCSHMGTLALPCTLRYLIVGGVDSDFRKFYQPKTFITSPQPSIFSYLVQISLFSCRFLMILHNFWHNIIPESYLRSVKTKGGFL